MSVTFRFEFGGVVHEESFTPEEWDLVHARTPDDWCGKLWSDPSSPLHDPEHTIPWPSRLR